MFSTLYFIGQYFLGVMIGRIDSRLWFGAGDPKKAFWGLKTTEKWRIELVHLNKVFLYHAYSWVIYMEWTCMVHFFLLIVLNSFVVVFCLVFIALFYHICFSIRQHKYVCVLPGKGGQGLLMSDSCLESQGCEVFFDSPFLSPFLFCLVPFFC